MKFYQFFAAWLVLFLANNLNAQSVGQIFVFESDANGFNTKTFFYDDGKEVVAFDAQFTPAAAQQAIDFLKTKTKNPISYLVISHPNPDKFNGIPTFQALGAKVIISKTSAANMPSTHNYKRYYFVEIAKLFSNETYPVLPQADITFEKEYTIAMANGGKVLLNELNQAGVSTNLTVAYISSLKSLFVGDLVHHNAHAWLEGPIINGKTVFNRQNWVNSLTSLQIKYAKNTIVYGGRGESGKLSVLIPQQIKYLQTAEKIVKNYLIGIGNDKNKVDYKAIQQLFEQKFPNYKIPYMVAYGAYGLVGSL